MNISIIGAIIIIIIIGFIPSCIVYFIINYVLLIILNRIIKKNNTVLTILCLLFIPFEIAFTYYVTYKQGDDFNIIVPLTMSLFGMFIFYKINKGILYKMNLWSGR